MDLGKIFKNTFLVIFMSLVLSACATQKKVSTGQMQGDVYTGTDTVEYLASGVPDRVFFATNESVLTTASRDTLRKQAAYMRKNTTLNNSSVLSYASKQNRAVIFPSWLPHWVQQNKSKNKRISIAWNIQVKGQVGEHHEFQSADF